MNQQKTGAFLKMLRKQKGLTQEQIAEKLRVHRLLLTGAIFWFVSSLINHTILNSNAELSAIADFAEGAAIGMIICGIVFTSRYGQRIKAFKQRLLKRQ